MSNPIFVYNIKFFLDFELSDEAIGSTIMMCVFFSV